MSLLSVRDLKVTFPTSGGELQAVRGVSLDIAAGEKVGLVGESGCGKSTLGRAIMRLVPVAEGEIRLQGTDLTAMSPRQLRPLRPLMQMIFQDPYGSINPRHSVGTTIGQPLSLAGWDRGRIAARVAELMGQVGLPAAVAGRYPHEFSGGQRQRIGIARALALHPKLLICDEPVSALDVSVRAQIINLLDDLQKELGVAYLFISHDLSVVQHFSDRVLVMYLGRLVETGDTETLWRASAHPYTRALLKSAPVADPRRPRPTAADLLQGELPNPLSPPPGCPFSSRCGYVQARCLQEVPELRPIAEGHQVACHFDLVTHGDDRPPSLMPTIKSAL
jgi:peptide/nickel transport system ATP-binding protein